MPLAMDRETQFQDLRPLLFGLAYRMLGTRADAEDVVQDAYLRWQSAAAEEVRSPKSYLTTIVARLALDGLKAAHRQRETYVGPWLPEPLVEPMGTQPVEMAESLSLAFLRLLESLSPSERVAFLLREVFDAGYDEVAAALETSEANSRQIVARARKHIQERRPRFPVDRERQLAVLREFLTACATGDPSQLTALLSEDAVLYTDGGGKVSAALNPIVGADRVVRFLIGIAPKIPALSVQFADVNGMVGAILLDAGRPYSVMAFDVTAEGRIANLYIVSNPDKLPPIDDWVNPTTSRPFAVCWRSQSSLISNPSPGPSGYCMTLLRTTGSFPAAIFSLNPRNSPSTFSILKQTDGAARVELAGAIGSRACRPVFSGSMTG